MIVASRAYAQQIYCRTEHSHPWPAERWQAANGFPFLRLDSRRTATGTCVPDKGGTVPAPKRVRGRAQRGNFCGMCNSHGACESGWREDLPDSCPPPDASDTGGEIVFHFLAGDKPEAEDFKPYIPADPQRHLMPTNLCRLSSVSVWTSEEKARLVLTTLPSQAGKRLGRVVLVEGAGVIKPTGQRFHSSWWMCSAFDPVQGTTVVPLEPTGT